MKRLIIYLWDNYIEYAYNLAVDPIQDILHQHLYLCRITEAPDIVFIVSGSSCPLLSQLLTTRRTTRQMLVATGRI